MAVGGTAGSAVASASLCVVNGELRFNPSRLMHPSKHETSVDAAVTKLLNNQVVNLPLDLPIFGEVLAAAKVKLAEKAEVGQ